MGAADVPVRLFRETLIWPLAVEVKAGATLTTAVGKLRARLTENGAWTAIHDLRRHLDQHPDDRVPLSADAYAEVVYFQPFVQRFLFPAPNTAGEPAGHLFRREDVKRVRLVYTEQVGDLSIDRDVELSVDRVHLYLFDSGIAVLAVEVSSVHGRDIVAEGPRHSEPELSDRHLRLKDVQAILSSLRNAYPPYWWGNGRICPASA